MATLDDRTAPLESQPREARCQIDLIQLVAFLATDLIRDVSTRHDFSLRLTIPTSDGVARFAGAEQAAIFLHCFGFSSELDVQLRISKLREIMPLGLWPLLALKDQPVVSGYFLADEGSLCDVGDPYVWVEGHPVTLAAIMGNVARICNYQSLIATRLSKYMVSPRVHPVQITSQRFPTPTLGAYYARASAIAGYDRSPGGSWHPGYDPTQPPFAGDLRWTINSQELVDEPTQRVRLLEAGYSESLADELWRSGVYAIPARAYQEHHLGSFALDGVEPGLFFYSDVDQMDTAIGEQRSSRFLLVDSYYQRIWHVMGIRRVATYGKTSKLPRPAGLTSGDVGDMQPYNETCSSLRPVSISRAESVCIPRFVVESYEELQEIVRRAEWDLARVGDTRRRIFFRGQRRHYSVSRSKKVFEFLYGTTFEDEVSLLTSASRKSFDYDRFAPAFQLQLQAILYGMAGTEAFQTVGSDWVDWPFNVCPFLDPRIEAAYGKWAAQYRDFTWDTTVMALAQHYNIPTHGVDLTEDLDTAIWFAMNDEGEGVRDQERAHPVVYLIASYSYLLFNAAQIEELGFDALRPKRQRAALHFGGWGLHTNVCAQDVIAIAELGESFSARKPLAHGYLFPGPDEDPFLRDLLELKANAQSQGITFGYSYIK